VTAGAHARARRTAPEPVVRAMRERDLSQVVAIETVTAATPWSRAIFAAELGRAGNIDLVVVRGGDVLGYILVSRYADVWHILNVCVREQDRGNGLGAMLLDDALARGDRSPHLGVTLEVRVSNALAIGLYERRGFSAHGIRRGYYSDNGEDAVIMWRAGEPD
jgi:[ribosomal protein S18]-alanine N-acetyltransferase